MKFGIMSMQRVLNYGSFMQALSLKRILETLGGDVVFIDYKTACCVKTKGNIREEIKYKCKKTKRAFKSKVKEILKRTKYNEKERAFYDFYDMLGISQKMRYHTKVDTMVVGSDEVFNCLQDAENVGFSMELFGKNNRAKKLVSYAACFGNTTKERLEQYGVEKIVQKNLKNFDCISVRDKNSGEVVKALTGKDPLYHMDPVFVGDIETLPWKKVDLKDYIVVYGYAKRFSEEEKEAIKAFAKKQNLKTVALCEKQDFCDISIRANVDEIIPYFQNAKYVITETFHGTLFSVITHTPFVTLVRKTVNNSYGNEEKLNDLLVRLDMEERKITDLNSLEEKMFQEIDFERLDSLREYERQRTLNYIKGFMEDH